MLRLCRPFLDIKNRDDRRLNIHGKAQLQQFWFRRQKLHRVQDRIEIFWQDLRRVMMMICGFACPWRIKEKRGPTQFTFPTMFGQNRPRVLFKERR
jgi:hypothetical protein